jgi:hypothetical protein
MSKKKKDPLVDSAKTVRSTKLWIAGLALAAQVSNFAAQVSSFEVASVKPVKPLAGPHVVSLIINHGRLNIEAAGLANTGLKKHGAALLY